MADAARDLVPGRTVVGFDQIRAMRWLVVAPATTTTVTADRGGPGQRQSHHRGLLQWHRPPCRYLPRAARDDRPAPHRRAHPARDRRPSSTTTGGCSTAPCSRAWPRSPPSPTTGSGASSGRSPRRAPSSTAPASSSATGCRWASSPTAPSSPCRSTPSASTAPSRPRTMPVACTARLTGPHRHRDAGRRHPAHARRRHLVPDRRLDDATVRHRRRHLEAQVQSRGRWGGRVPAGWVVPGR